MNILLIDLGSSYLDELVELLGTCNVRIAKQGVDHSRHGAWADRVVLSGGHGHPAADVRFYAPEIELIKSCGKRLLGICLGHQLIAAAYGGSLRRSNEKIRGYRPITVNGLSGYLNHATVEVYENHRWAVVGPGSELRALAWSASGIEILQHRYLPIVGMQFHPEITAKSSAGKALFLQQLGQA
jgi:anthranilate/para-aminobenzoate synthase component II